ncbi:MAG TPA: hypothetical protein VK449_06965 [Anaerolineales bacterium]|nr:hypothetical protein [Anaerolineales bacterium]
MAENAVLKKLKLKPGVRAAVVSAPEGYLKKLRPLPAGASLSEKLAGDFDWIQLFVRKEADLKKSLPAVVRALRPDGMLWIAFPKSTSKIQSDLTRDQGWDPVKPYNLKWLTLVSVDDTWSAFALRRYRPGEARQTFR